MRRIIKFEVGLLFGTVLGAVVAAFICSIIYEVLGYQAVNMSIIQDCLEGSLDE